MKIQLEEADRNMVNLVQEKSLLETEKELREKVNSLLYLNRWECEPWDHLNPMVLGLTNMNLVNSA